LHLTQHLPGKIKFYASVLVSKARVAEARVAEGRVAEVRKAAAGSFEVKSKVN
jgi:hypothetical protein